MELETTGTRPVEGLDESGEPVPVLGGWLAFFAVTLTLQSLYAIVIGLTSSPWHAITTALGAWGLFVAVQIFRLHPRAGRYATTYMLVLLILSALVLLRGGAAEDAKLVLSGVRDSAFAALWLGYFERSRRVAATFGTAPPSTFFRKPAPQPPAPPLRLDGWTGGAVRQCPACGLGNPARATQCSECRASLSGTVPFTPSEPCPT